MKSESCRLPEKERVKANPTVRREGSADRWRVLLCSYSSQAPPADSCDTSHLVFELHLQLSVTGTSASINIFSPNSRSSRPTGSSVLTDFLCLLPQGLQAQRDKGTNIMFCVKAASIVSLPPRKSRKKMFCSICFCCFVSVWILMVLVISYSSRLNNCMCFVSPQSYFTTLLLL